jgi:hypothetical protein
MKTIAALLFLLFATFDLAACKSLPGGDGQYATFDHGALNRGP